MRFTVAIIIMFLAISAGVFHVDAQNKRKPALEKRAEPNKSRDDKEEDKTEVLEIDKDELEAADKLRIAIGPRKAALINCLRYLIRPEFEDELMLGRRHRPSVLEPFESEATETPSNLDLLRLLAVLQAGIQATQTVEDHFQMFLESKPKSDDLARLGVEMLVLTVGHKHRGIVWDGEIEARAKVVFGMSQKLRKITSATSSLIDRDVYPARWFGNHLWRAIIFSGALQLGLEIDREVWQEDLRLLLRTFVSKRGFTATKARVNRDHPEIRNELNCNLLALAALRLALESQEKFLPRKVIRNIRTKFKKMPKILTKLAEDYGDVGFGSGRLWLSMSMGELAPDRTTATTWRDGMCSSASTAVGPTGEIPPTSEIARDLGLGEESWRRGHAAAAETALFLLGLSGGIMPSGEQPMINEDADFVGRTMYSLALLHAKQADPKGEGFQADVDYAIKTGAEYLASMQKDNGLWPGRYVSRSGETALCMLAMLHGGWNRNEQHLVSGMQALVRQAGCKSLVQSYDAACVLMMFQKYYEKEQIKAGVLAAQGAKKFKAARERMYKSLDSEHRILLDKMLQTLEATGVGDSHSEGYGYRTKNGNGHSDNSCSQYVILGYKSASLLGLKVKHQMFGLEANRLLSEYHSVSKLDAVEYKLVDAGNGKTSSGGKKGKIVPGGWGYMTAVASPTMQMTAAGMSSLAICRDELEIRGQLTRMLRFKIGLHIRGAEAFIASQYYTKSQFEDGRSSLTSANDGVGIYYNLYSVERGCELASISKLNDEIDWYRIGAQGLIDAQSWGGGWGVTAKPRAGAISRPRIVNTCMAILFLKRASLPVLTGPKKIRKPEKVITEGPKPVQKPKPEPKEEGPITGR